MDSYWTILILSMLNHCRIIPPRQPNYKKKDPPRSKVTGCITLVRMQSLQLDKIPGFRWKLSSSYKDEYKSHNSG